MSVTTGKVRLSYVHAFSPYSSQGQEPKYSVTVLVPKTDVTTINALIAEIELAKQYGVQNTWGGKMPPIVKIPIYDGDGVRPSGEPFGEECKGHMVFTASSKVAPQVVDANIQPLLNQTELYSGCYGRVSVNFFAYSQNGNKGVGCGLNCIQKIEDGEPLGGGVSAAEAFGGTNTYGSVVAAPAYPAQFMQGVQNGAVAPYQMPQAQMPYQVSQPQYQMPQAQIPGMKAPSGMPQPQMDPITGMPILNGGIMGV